jgi:hypothetical protein
VLLYNALAWVGQGREAPAELAPGVPARLRVPGAAVTAPDGAPPALARRDGDALVFVPARAGFYRVGDLTLPASLLDAGESRIVGDRLAARAGALVAVRLVDREPWSLLLILALLLTLLEWRSYHRRVTA